MYHRYNLKKLEEVLGYTFKDKILLLNALAHTSYINENLQGGLKGNERLEFLGDTIIALFVAEYLYKKFPGYREGELSLLKSWLVSEKTLTKLANKIELGKYLLLGKGEDTPEGRGKSRFLCNTMEAIIGAVYIDSGFTQAKKILGTLYKEIFEELPSFEKSLTYKNRLQQYTQKTFGTLPLYEVVSEIGPSHKKVYEVKVSFDGKEQGRGTGSSKKKAEQKAAEEALRKLGLIDIEPQKE